MSTTNDVSRAKTPTGAGNTTHRKLLPLIISAFCAFLLGYQLRTLDIYTSNTYRDFAAAIDSPESSGYISTAATPSLIEAENRLENEDEADYIIRRSYLKSYAHILQCDNSTVEGKCLQKTRQHFNPSTEAARKALPSVPWWFQTLLRDTVKNGAYGSWHHFSTTDPALHFCTIEKVGTTEWRRVFCDMNGDECPENKGNYPNHCMNGLPGRKCAFRTKKDVPADAPQAVFVRDPLERVLSAFLDKCVRAHLRRNEKHCEPNEVFNTEGWGEEKRSPTQDFETNPKQFFAAYLDIMPLKWNLHFVPQALYCDLYRRIDTDYSFVGKMGKEFMSDLERMANKFGGRLPSQLNKTFDFIESVESKQFNNTGNSNPHATRSPEKVTQYYNAASVRKALEYFSIDYVTLGMAVPEWAREMLRNETP